MGIEEITGPSVLVCWCDLVDRGNYDWRSNAENCRHSISFAPGDPFPDGELTPCPVDGCSGQVRLKPAPSKPVKKKRTGRKKRGSATKPAAPDGT